MILKYFVQIFKYFKEDRISFFKYSILSLFAGILELLGVALIYPFILRILSNKPSDNLLLSPVFIGVAIIFLFLLKNLFMIFYTYIQSKFTNEFEAKIKKSLMTYFLSAEYISVSKLSFSEKGKIFGFLIPNLMNNFILRLFNLVVNIIIAVLLVSCIAFKFPLATGMSFVFAVLFVAVQNKIYKPILTKLSQKLSEKALLYERSYNETVLNLKEVKLSNNEKYFYENYSNKLDEYINNRKKISFFNLIPPYVIEPFVIVLLFVLLSIICVQNYQSLDKLIASFALIASAIFRLTPAIARIQVNFNGINSVLPIVQEFIEVYEKYKIADARNIVQNTFAEFNDSIELKNISFSYDGEKDVLHNINLKINKGEFLGFAGASGVGKTTLIDIISGLYTPSIGQIFVDGVEKTSLLKIGYIPQEFSLIYGNIRENVAFGSPETDDNKVVDALKKAQLYDFIIENFKDGIYANPFVDSNGFSVGQRQRIAIARALYQDPEILILDEATSSLDLKTENEICEVLNGLKGQKTILVIAHRLSTIKNADRIIYMENGTISEIASYEALIEKSEGFRNLTRIASK